MTRLKDTQPKRIIEQLVSGYVPDDKFYARNFKPGEIIQSLGPVKRQILKDLKSEDIADVRWPRI